MKMKHTMKMKFNNPVFNKGLNLTVRRDTKWFSYLVTPSPTTFEIERRKGTQKASVAAVAAVPFYRLKDSGLLEFEHDPACRTYGGLLKVMQDTYPGFKEEEIVTLVFFKLVGDTK
jgi:hypothetical protein